MSEYDTKIKPDDKKYYAPNMARERQFHLVSGNKKTAIRRAEESEGRTWEELQDQGWKIEIFYGSEYE
ncbi:MAG: hypothetical protein PF693_09895 [Spirochaetia bacterium]|jgi:hypothetical protein|nr:hypothetical protein [Spirochaetia bacterium]